MSGLAWRVIHRKYVQGLASLRQAHPAQALLPARKVLVAFHREPLSKIGGPGALGRPLAVLVRCALRQPAVKRRGPCQNGLIVEVSVLPNSSCGGCRFCQLRRMRRLRK